MGDLHPLAGAREHHRVLADDIAGAHGLEAHGEDPAADPIHRRGVVVVPHVRELEVDDLTAAESLEVALPLRLHFLPTDRPARPGDERHGQPVRAWPPIISMDAGVLDRVASRDRKSTTDGFAIPRMKNSFGTSAVWLRPCRAVLGRGATTRSHLV